MLDNQKQYTHTDLYAHMMFCGQLCKCFCAPSFGFRRRTESPTTRGHNECLYSHNIKALPMLVSNMYINTFQSTGCISWHSAFLAFVYFVTMAIHYTKAWLIKIINVQVNGNHVNRGDR